MKLILAGLMLVMIVGAHAQPLFRFPHGFKGPRIFRDVSEDNLKNSDVHENNDAAKGGPGEKWAAEVVSNGGESMQGMTGHGNEDAAADQEANRRRRNV